MVAPRMLGPEVRLCYEEGIGFITAVGVHRNLDWQRGAGAHPCGGEGGRRAASGRRRAHAPPGGGARPRGRTALSPTLTLVHTTFVQVMLEQGIPLAAVLTELVLSGEVERTMRLIRESGYAAQFGYHSPTSQYGQLTRRGEYDHLDLATTMRRLVDDITSGRFADEWDADATPATRSCRHCGNSTPAPQWRSSRKRCVRNWGRGRPPGSRPLFPQLSRFGGTF